MSESSHLSATVATRYWTRLDDGRVRCDVCPRYCKLKEGKRGVCFVRAREGDEVVLTTYGRSTGFCVDPIEKKPLYHFYPGSAVLSFGTAGCNLKCKFCQNWDMSTSRDLERRSEEASPETIARAARELGCRSVAFTYNDPVVFLEYAVDVARACHEQGIRTVAVTAGEINPDPRREFFHDMDAANIDLKSFEADFYRKLCGGDLKTVLDTLLYLRHETDVWIEITTLLIPGENDSDSEIDRLTAWVARELGSDVPVHFTAFHPDYKMMDHPATPPSTLTRARNIALANGLDFAYTGNVYDAEGSTTSCPECAAELIGRDWHRLTTWHLTGEHTCPECGTTLAGHFDSSGGRWGGRRLPVSLSEFVQKKSG